MESLHVCCLGLLWLVKAAIFALVGVLVVASCRGRVVRELPLSVIIKIALVAVLRQIVGNNGWATPWRLS